MFLRASGGAFGFSLNTNMFGERFMAAMESYHQNMVLRAAQRTRINVASGILS